MQKLYCIVRKETFSYCGNGILPGRCYQCENKTCLEAMKERVYEEQEKAQLELGFDYGE